MLRNDYIACGQGFTTEEEEVITEVKVEINNDRKSNKSINPVNPNKTFATAARGIKAYIADNIRGDTQSIAAQ